MPSIKNWLLVARLPSLILALTSVMLGTCLAIWQGTWNYWVGLLAVITASMLQLIANLANDYGDFLQGAAVEDRVGNPGEKKKNGLVSLQELKKAILLLVCFTIGCGLLLLRIADLAWGPFIQFTLLGSIAIVAAMAYTIGPKPYAYIGMGDLAVLLFFGCIGVLGTVYLHTKAWNWTYVLPSLSCGSFATAVLNLNNIRDIELDAAIGKKTLVVRIGRKAAIYYQWILLGLGISLLVTFTILHYHRPYQWLFLSVVPRIIQNGRMTMRLAPKHLDALLQRLVVTQLFLLLFFGLGLVISNYW